MASVQKTWGKYEPALENYNKFIEINPNYPDAIYNRGDILFCLKRFEEALESFNLAISKRPEWALYYCNRARLYMEMGRKQESLDDLNLASKYSKNLKPTP